MNTKTIAMDTVNINGIDVLILKKNIKNFHLNVLPPEGRVRVSVPAHTGDEAVRLFVITRMQWIKKQIGHFQNQARQTKREYVSGESHYFKGQRFLLRVIEQRGKAKIEIKNKKYICLYVPRDYTRGQKEKLFLKWYRTELKKELHILIDKWEKIVGVKSNEVRIKRMKTKWGTCKPEIKRIWINLELIKKPGHCLEYIIVHELVHLLEKKHNEKFRQYMDKFMPNWRQYKSELNEFVLSE